MLADGGFQGNPERLKEYVGPAVDQMKLRSLGMQTGDGIRMATVIGAATVNMQYFYGHMLSVDAMTNDELRPYPLMDGAICDGILVHKDGNRFLDERMAGSGMSRRAMSGIGVANAVGRARIRGMPSRYSTAPDGRSKAGIRTGASSRRPTRRTRPFWSAAALFWKPTTSSLAIAEHVVRQYMQ